VTVMCQGGYRHSRASAGGRGTCPVCGQLQRVALSQLYGYPVIVPHGDPRHPANWTQLTLPFGDASAVSADTDRNQ